MCLYDKNEEGSSYDPIKVALYLQQMKEAGCSVIEAKKFLVRFKRTYVARAIGFITTQQ